MENKVKIEQYIKELLYANDSLIIPDFGVLTTEYQSAVIDPKKSQISPPQKCVKFEAKKVADDSVLINHVAERNNITKTEAKEKIFTYVTNAFVKLEQGNKLVMDEIGVFNYDKKRKLIFEAQTNANFHAESFGLDTVKISQTEKIIKKQGSEIVKPQDKKPVLKSEKPQKTTTKAEKKKNNSKYIYISAAVVLIAVFVFLGFKMGWLDSAKTYVGDLTGSNKSEVTTTKKIDNTTEVKNKTENINKAKETKDETNNSNIAENKTTEAKANRANNTETKIDNKEYVEPKVKADSKKTFHIIAGSYSSYESALEKSKNYIANGYNSEVLDKENNVYRVTLGSYKYKNQAIKELNKFREKEGESIWILSR